MIMLAAFRCNVAALAASLSFSFSRISRAFFSAGVSLYGGVPNKNNENFHPPLKLTQS